MLKKLTNNFNFQLIVFTLIVFISRLPFLNAGYGTEEDSWGIAVAAHNTMASGIFEASRLPGHPVQELIYSAIWGAGPLVFNLLSAVFSTIAVMFFVLFLKTLGFKKYFLAGLAFAFTPVVYIASTYTIDYMWTCALIFISLYFLIKQRIGLAAIILGLAIGCRITSVVLLLPFSIILLDFKIPYFNIKKILLLWLSTTVIGILCYLPVIDVYGINFFTYSDQFPYPTLEKVFYKASFGVWGLLGILAILLCCLIN